MHANRLCNCTPHYAVIRRYAFCVVQYVRWSFRSRAGIECSRYAVAPHVERGVLRRRFLLALAIVILGSCLYAGLTG